MTPNKLPPMPDETAHIDLTDDVGATVKVYSFWKDRVHLSMGGDLSVSVGMPPDAAIELGNALIAAAAYAKEGTA